MYLDCCNKLINNVYTVSTYNLYLLISDLDCYFNLKSTNTRQLELNSAVGTAGIEPTTSRSRTERSTDELRPEYKDDFCNCFVIPRSRPIF